MCDTKNTEMTFPKKQRCGDATRQLPLEEDFIMSASAPFTYSVHSHNDSSLAAQPLKSRDSNTPVPPRQPYRDAPIRHAAAYVLDTNQADVHSPKNQLLTTNASPTTAAAPPLLLLPHLMENSNNTGGAGNVSGSPNWKADTPPAAVAAAAAVVEVPAQFPATTAEVRKAMSPASAAGRLAYVADVTARVQRMRMRGRRAPEVAFASGALWTTSSDSTSPATPQSPNVDLLPLMTSLQLPRRIRGPVRPKV